MTSLMTSPGHKVGQILILIYHRQYWARAAIKSWKYRKCLWLSIWCIQHPVSLPVKRFLQLKMATIFENLEILNTGSIWPQIWKDRPKLCHEIFFMMMTSPMTSQGGLNVGPLYSFVNEITIFMITKKQEKISSLNFLCKGIMRLWINLYKRAFMTSLMTSPGHKVSQIFKLIYIPQYSS